ncbi:MAG: crossover junction endodeoxyribonuclease RuvC, partial [Armatimonadota bacterium]
MRQNRGKHAYQINVNPPVYLPLRRFWCRIWSGILAIRLGDQEIVEADITQPVRLFAHGEVLRANALVAAAAHAGRANSRSKDMRILGIDPGTATTGYGVVERVGSTARLIGYGAITTSL